MLEFAATPERVRAATKWATTMNIPMRGISEYWAAQPRTQHIPGFAFQLKPYQAEGVAHLEKWDGNALVADEPGTGKTATVMAYAWKHGKFPMCVIMPKTLLLNWRREITLMLGTQLTVQIVGVTLSKRREQALKIQYPHVTFSKTVQPGYQVTLINYDIVARNQTDLEQQSYSYVVLDESHKIKNHKAQRTQAILRLVTGRQAIKGKRGQYDQLHAGVPSVTFLSGTPQVNRPIELFTTVNTVAPWVPEFNNFWSFASRYCGAEKTSHGWDFSGHSNTQELHDLLKQTVMIRRLKQDVMHELPAKTFVTVPLEFDRGAYDAVAKAFEGTADWKQGMETLIRHGGHAAQSSAAIVALNKCREIAAYSKLDGAVEWILDYVEQGRKLVVFAHHQKMVDHITSQLQSAGVGVRMIRGGVDLEARAQAAQDFQTCHDVKVIVLNIASAGFGITLTAAHACAFCQLPWSPADLIQAADRVHRLGQLNNVTVYNLVAADTVEEEIGDLIMAKAAVNNQVMDGGANQELATMSLHK
jgi:SWI/SNF-related matrix-associated actin-dependent regulator of chromatin subfamily A-like protein 1